jgi:hypothetical protein
MDGAAVSHYVAPAALAGERLDLELILELLLFLSAMLAGLTGLISGDRAVETRQVERAAVAVSAAIEVGARAAEAASVARAAHPVPGRTFRTASDAEPASTVEALPQSAPVDERRLE